jgi:hypothetical protein
MAKNARERQKDFFSCAEQISTTLILAAAIVFFSAVQVCAVYTPKQLEALSSRIGKTFWILSVDGRTPDFLSRPAAGATSFKAGPNDSFVIVELVGQKTNTLYYRVKFDSDKEGYITPGAFHEDFNLTILSTDPHADEKKKAAQALEEDKQRKDWIQAQAWSQVVKEAAIDRRPVPGMTATEVRKVLGAPLRVIKAASGQKAAAAGRQNLAEERWVYPNGSELIFHNTLLIRVDSKESREPSQQGEKNPTTE